MNPPKDPLLRHHAACQRGAVFRMLGAAIGTMSGLEHGSTLASSVVAGAGKKTLTRRARFEVAHIAVMCGQTISDLLNLEVRVSASVEATAIGIANLAGVSALGTSFDQLARNWKAEKVYTPNMKEEDRSKKLEKWNKALEAVKKFHD